MHLSKHINALYFRNERAGNNYDWYQIGDLEWPNGGYFVYGLR